METYVIEKARIPEVYVKGKRLGRNLNHDSRSKHFRVAERINIESVVHERRTKALDQANLGSCVGNATIGVLATEPFYSTLEAIRAEGTIRLDEGDAIDIYSRATQLDGFPGEYPPEDTGSDGLSGAKAALEKGLITGYTHALSFDEFLAGMQEVPAIVGTNWRTGMDEPDDRGIVSFAGEIRGGHEYEAAEVDMQNELVWFWNSWGRSYGLSGKFGMPFADFERALAESGDATFFVPLDKPAPIPVPVPIRSADDKLITGIEPWAAEIESVTTHAGKAKAAFEGWKKEKGYV